MSSYKCSNCSRISNNKWNMEEHIRRVCKQAVLIEDIVMLKCDICGKEFETQKRLDNHKNRCFEKKTLVKVEYKDVNKVEEFMHGCTLLITSLKQENEYLKNTLENVIKRLDKLELKEEEEKVEGTVEGDMCEYCKVIKFIPTSKQQIKNTLVDMGYTNYKTVGLTIDGQRSLEMQGQVHNEYIEVNGDKYFYKPDKKQRGTGLIKILVNKYCDQEAVKNGRCERHQ